MDSKFGFDSCLRLSRDSSLNESQFAGDIIVMVACGHSLRSP